MEEFFLWHQSFLSGKAEWCWCSALLWRETALCLALSSRANKLVCFISPSFAFSVVYMNLHCEEDFARICTEGTSENQLGRVHFPEWVEAGADECLIHDGRILENLISEETRQEPLEYGRHCNILISMRDLEVSLTLIATLWQLLQVSKHQEVFCDCTMISK